MVFYFVALYFIHILEKILIINISSYSTLRPSRFQGVSFEGFYKEEFSTISDVLSICPSNLQCTLPDMFGHTSTAWLSCGGFCH